MTVTDGPGHRRQPDRRVDGALVALAVVLTLFTATVVAVPMAAPALVNDRLDIAIVTAAMLISGAVAALDSTRGRVVYDPAAVLRSSAFTVLALLNGSILVVAVVGADATLGASLTDPGQLPLIAAVLGRGVAAALLVAAGWAAISRGLPPLGMRLMLVGPAALVLVLLIVAAVARDALPELAPSATLAALAADPTSPLAPGAAPALVVLQAVIGAGFLVAAVLAHRSFTRSGRSADVLLAAGLLVAAFSQVHSAIHPGSYSGLVTVGDLLRLVFYGLLLFGVVAERREDLSDLRAATMEVRRLAKAEFATAALEERARLAREIHDGLAQDLWYAKLKQSRLAQLVGFAGEARQLSDEVGEAIDSALAEARDAVTAMRAGAESGSLLEILSRHVDDFADRFALRAEVTRDGPAPAIGPKAQAELLRIVQEALTNVRKHADATIVRVHVASGDALRVIVTDNGRGFRPDAVTAGFGLESMRQRAALIGAQLTITSEPQNGTRVELSMPVSRQEERDGA